MAVFFLVKKPSQDFKGITPLGYAIGANRIAVVKLLLDRGCVCWDQRDRDLWHLVTQWANQFSEKIELQVDVM